MQCESHTRTDIIRNLQIFCIINPIYSHYRNCGFSADRGLWDALSCKSLCSCVDRNSAEILIFSLRNVWNGNAAAIVKIIRFAWCRRQFEDKCCMISTVGLKYGVKLYRYEFYASGDLLTLEVFETVFSVRREAISCGFLLKVQYFKTLSPIINSCVNKLSSVRLFVSEVSRPCSITLAILGWQWRLWMTYVRSDWGQPQNFKGGTTFPKF
jgi:hypothetical protein